MDILQQVKDKLEEMKSKYNQEHDDEDNPNHSDGFGMYWSGVFACLKEISFFVDHLEVKEVDLEKEINTYISNNFFGSETLGFFANRTKGEPDDQDIALCAKHFFELGLRSTITEEDCKLIWNIGDEIPNMPEEEFFKELLKRFKVLKGE